MENELSYFSRQGRMSDPGQFASFYEGLPKDIPALVKTVQELTIHVFWAESYGLQVPPERKVELQLRSMEKRLARALELDPRPFNQPRATDKKLLGNCRDFSLLMVSMLRHLGLPARARCGFGAYFQPNHFEDHWVAEYWNATQKRWMLVDAQLDALQRQALAIDFNFLNVPRDQFIVGGKAWQMCRSGQADPETFGIFDMHGLGFIGGNLLRDLAALNEMELLPWDCWGMMLRDNLDDPADLALLDQAAALTAVDAPPFEAARELYASSPLLRMDGKILSFVEGVPTPLDLGFETAPAKA